MAQFVTIARILKVRGIRGEVSALILTDFPERFSRLDRVFLLSPRRSEWVELENHWFQGRRVVLKFKGCNERDQAQELVGCDVQIPDSQTVQLPKDTYFDDDLIGCEVFQDGIRVGCVSSLFKVSGYVSNLVIEGEDDTELMLPAVREFVLEVNIQEKRIDARLPEGLREATSSPRSLGKKGES